MDEVMVLEPVEGIADNSEITEPITITDVPTMSEEAAIEELQSQVDEIQEEYKDVIQKSTDEFKEIMKDMTLEKLINEMRSEVEKTQNKMLRNMLKELESSINLKLLYESASHSMKGFPEKYEKNIEKFRRSLMIEKKYRFRDPMDIETILTRKLESEERARMFLYSLCRFMNPKRDGARRYPIFISEIINNIFASDNENYNFYVKEEDIAYRSQVINEIDKYVEFLTK
jgi:hypothetical protein